MNLSKVFSGESNTTNLAKTSSQQSSAQSAQMNHQIRSLVPGQTLSGEIVGKNGSEVQIKLSEDMILNARVDQNLNIEVGQNMTFQVKANGLTLTLSPLFTNVATDVNVLKALDMAGLPVNETSVAMTEQLMGAGMSVNRNFLLQVYREINNFPQGEVSDVVNLHKLGMPVNEANMSQMESYRNLTHQLVGGMDRILSELPGVAEHMMANGDAAGVVNLYQELFALVSVDDSVGSGVGYSAGLSVIQNADGSSMNLATVQELVSNTSQTISTPNVVDNMILADTDNNIPAETRMTMAQDVLQLMDTLPLTSEQSENLRTQMQQFAEGHISVKQFFAGMQQLTEAVQSMPQNPEQAILQNPEQVSASGAMVQENVLTATQIQPDVLQNLQKLFSKPEFKNQLLNELKNQWMLTPEEVSEPDKVGDSYRKLDRQLKNLTQVLEHTGQQESTAFKAVSNMSQNIDFLQQINQMYTYVQLPLKMQGQDTNGELYVYANRKNLAKNDGNISALLHLDMVHLGPVDVYVTMQSSKVNTKFYVRDDEMLDFLAEHMDLLTERLKKRGYDCSFSMTTRDNTKDETTEGGIASVLKQEKGVVLSHYAFDVRT